MVAGISSSCCRSQPAALTITCCRRSTWSGRCAILPDPLRLFADLSRPNLTDVAASTSVTVSGYAVQREDRQSEYSAVPGQCVRPVVRVVSGAGYAALGGAVPQGRAAIHLHAGRQHGLRWELVRRARIRWPSACGSTPGCSPNATWAFSVPVNSPGGTSTASSSTTSSRSRFLPRLLRNTGRALNYTYVESKVKYLTGPNTYVTGELEGLSKDTAGAVLYYENPKWSMRLSGAYRSRYLTQVPGPGGGHQRRRLTMPHSTSMRRLQYNVTDHFRVSLEGVNLTDQYENEFNDTSRNLVYYYHHTGRQILLGARYQY
jgi:hypothetical protein